ncbi:MAG TPA: phage baseplate assembly protein V [Pyrinomonadaceae bacterium]|nr:phage baseplate assembly protein V [Pyrinomonadaceae bacterium]
MTVMEAAPKETQHEAGGVVKGVAIALVTQNNDDEKLCRVKVSYPWHDQPRESYWARLSVPMAGNDRGVVMIPEVGDEVLVAFEREDLRFPYILGGLWNGKDKPPITNDDGKNDKRIIKSRDGHYLLYNDNSSDGEVILTHKKGRRIAFTKDGWIVEDENGNKVEVKSTSGEMTIEAKGQLKIKAASITIEATGTVEVKASATMTLRGSLVNIN